MHELTQIDNVEFYLKNFSLINFIDSIKIIPSAWHQYRVGKDDFIGVDIGFENDFKADSYFLLSESLFHEQLGEVWSDFGSNSYGKREIEAAGMIKEWAIAKKIQGEICFNILNNYNSSKHREQLIAVNDLSKIELSELSRLYYRKGIHHLVFYTSNNRCIACTNKNQIFLDQYELDSDGIFGLVKKGFLKNLKFQVDYSDKLAHEMFKKYILENHT